MKAAINRGRLALDGDLFVILACLVNEVSDDALWYILSSSAIDIQQLDNSPD